MTKMTGPDTETAEIDRSLSIWNCLVRENKNNKNYMF